MNWLKKTLVPLIVGSIVISGCASSSPKPAPERQRAQNRVEQRSTAASRKAVRVARIADSVKNVDSAYAVITADNTMIGINVSEKVASADVPKVERQVKKVVKQKVAGIKGVMVTSDPNLVTRIRKVSRGIAEGRPLSSFKNEIRQLVVRLQPR